MTLNVVVVDDETPICEWLVYCIQRASHECHVMDARNGDDAFALIKKQKPDLVFTDIRMPGMDGLELMRRTLEILPFTVFVILTNYAEFSYAKEAVSLGAKEYLLKSELRARDIEKLLSLVLAQKIEAVQGKTGDIYQSGYIDLYNFFQTQEEPDYADRFWAKQGMLDNVPYQILCLPGKKTQEEWKGLVQIANDEKNKFPDPVYTAVACEKDFDYCVLQAHQLSELTAGLLKSIQTRDVGISTIFHRRCEFPRALHEANTAQTATFFTQEAPIYYASICLRPALDRDALRCKKQEILAMILQRRYAAATGLVNEWFAEIGKAGAVDLAWAVDNCRRIVLSIEERYYHETESSSQTMVIQTNVRQCEERCRELLNDLEGRYCNHCSPLIVASLEYIHQHYADNISMAEAARRAYRSMEYFSRQFKEEVGENFNTYLTLYRLVRAQELLLQTDLRISEVAEKVGYSTPGYFSRIYKRYKGITPEQERMSRKKQ